MRSVSKSSGFKSPLRPSAASASVPNTSQETKYEMQISIASDVANLSTTSHSHQPATVATSTALDPVFDQFQQMRLMISSFLGARQDPTPGPRQSFCNYLHSETKLLSEIQCKAEEQKRQVTTSQQVTTFQVPEATQARAG